MGAQQKHALTPEAAMTARRMYAEQDSRGRRIHSYRSIARFLAVSESTVMRAINGDGAYMATPEYVPDQTMRTEAQASLARLLADPTLAKHVQLQEPQQDVLDKLNADIARSKAKDRQGDEMLDELRGQQGTSTGRIRADQPAESNIPKEKKP